MTSHDALTNKAARYSKNPITPRNEYITTETWDTKKQSFKEFFKHLKKDFTSLVATYVIKTHRAEDKNSIVIYAISHSKTSEPTVHLFISATFCDGDAQTVFKELEQSGIENITLKDESAIQFHSDPLGIVAEIERHSISPITQEFIDFCIPLFESVSFSYSKGGNHTLCLWSKDDLIEPTACITFEESTPSFNYIWFEYKEIQPLNRDLNLAKEAILSGLKDRAQKRKESISFLTRCAADCADEKALEQFPKGKQKYPDELYLSGGPHQEAATFLNLAVSILRRHGGKSAIRFKKDPTDYQQMHKRIKEINATAEKLYQDMW